MWDVLNDIVDKIKGIRIRKMQKATVLLVLSLVVSLSVFWILRQPGLTLAGDADCKIIEHTHTSECSENGCQLKEHVHTVECYSDETADVESKLDWEKMFAKYPYTGNLRKDLVGVAKTQVGYSESRFNFMVDDDGVRRGYTRYGAWYGAPYNDWSAMFVSYCLNYAGADTNQFPTNSGAFSMAMLWQKQGKFMEAGQYKPVSGDLIFFDDNTVGIVTEVYNTTCYVVRGDIDDTVCGGLVFLGDKSIYGWGITDQTLMGSITDGDFGKDPLDITNGPSLIIYEGGKKTSSNAKLRTYALRTTNTTPIDLIDYLNKNSGSYQFTILDKDNHALQTDDDGNFIAIANTGYKLTISFLSPEGLKAGTYYYQIPSGFRIDGGKGNFILRDNTFAGTWEVSNTGLITLNLNDSMNDRSDVILSATMGIHFPEPDKPVDFDGKITVTVHPQTDDDQSTHVAKWGQQGDPNDPQKVKEGFTNSNKIYWRIVVTGRKDSKIPGNALIDTINNDDWTGVHRYTASDMAAGIDFAFSDNMGGWHTYRLYPGEPGLTWTEQGWSYQIPEKLVCNSCHQELTLGNDGWVYYFTYTTTPDADGKFDHANGVSIDNHYADGWSGFLYSNVHADVEKTGSFTGDANSGAFLWEMQVSIPGRASDAIADYHWYLMDYMFLFNKEGVRVENVYNDACDAIVTATYNGETHLVPRIQDATGDELFVWDNAWSSQENGSHTNVQEMTLLHKCDCTEDTCRFWNGGCQCYWYINYDGSAGIKNYCQCWTLTENTTFNIVYQTKDMSLVEKYGALGYKIQNTARLFHKPNGGNAGEYIGESSATVSIPTMFDKVITKDFDGYKAQYKITVNEAKIPLTNGSSLIVKDIMSKTLAYINGSMVILAEDAGGNVTQLVRDQDFIITYDGSGKEKNDNDEPAHILYIEILNPQPVKYTITYDATLIFETGVASIKSSNYAKITLWGKEMTDESTVKYYADFSLSATTYEFHIHKSDAIGNVLQGAVFGVYRRYDDHDGLIAVGTTDENGAILLETDLENGIVFREHVLYYVQELRAPPGYALDDTKYWFCFCNSPEGQCDSYTDVTHGLDVMRIPFETVGEIHITNHPLNYDLPATGGIGVIPFIIVSIILIVIPLIYRCIKRRKRERRGVG
ncbi:MAG: hypothetical protein J6S00_01800 [Clostridia bacterium]|nr:hypothetical protein [Clostridia bacterium]